MKPTLIYLRPYSWVETDGRPHRILGNEEYRLAVSELAGFIANLEPTAELALMKPDRKQVECYLGRP